MDILANLSFLIVAIAIIMLNLILMGQNEENSFLIVGFYIGWLAYAFIYSQWLRSGFGNLIIAIITHSMFFVVIIALLISFFVVLCEADFEKNLRFLFVVFAIICTTAVIAYAIFCVYERLKLEEILNIEFFNKIIEDISSFKFPDDKTLKIFATIVNNEWFREIGTQTLSGIVGTVLGGVILDRILNKNRQKKFRRKNKKDIEKKLRGQKSQSDKDSKNK